MPGKQNEAANWFAAQRRGVMTVEECENFEAWQNDKGNRAAFGDMEDLWKAVGIAAPHFTGIDGSTAAMRRQGFGRLTLLAATCVLTLGLGVLSHSGHSSFWTTLDWTNR